AAYSISISSIGNNILQKHVSNQQRSPRVGSTTIVTTRKIQTTTTTRTIIGYSLHKTGAIKCKTPLIQVWKINPCERLSDGGRIQLVSHPGPRKANIRNITFVT
uniref:Uncharacterized protein n=1 Tax=Glossina pallidipes TaxID=7398 RepID=A0A1B0ACQ3_GLOPL